MSHPSNPSAENENRRLRSAGRRRRWRFGSLPRPRFTVLLIVLFVSPLISCDIILELDLDNFARSSADSRSSLRICAAEFDGQHICKEGSFGERLVTEVELSALGDGRSRLVQMPSNRPWEGCGLFMAVELRRGDSGGERWAPATLRYRLRCAENFYGNNCTRHCEIKPWERAMGMHWSCEPDGVRRCEAGWTGGQCTLRRCPGCVNGTCEGRLGRCVCRLGYRGDRCDECVPPAKCKGSCNSTQSCVCPEGRGGIYCELDLVYCTKYKPCQNGGLCTNRNGSYHCQCRPGFKGRDCELPISGCEDHPCQNGGVCRHSATNPQGFHCQCPAGTYGRHCQAWASSCRESPCENGASCAELSSKVPSLRRLVADHTPPFRCFCPKEWKGELCDTPPSCASDSCFNGGTCTEDLNTELGFHCLCPLGFRGLRCEEDIDDCQMNPCQNGGVCVDRVAAFRCDCLAGYGGPLCEEVSDHQSAQPAEERGKRRPANSAALDQSSLNWLFLSVSIVLFLLIALLLLICYLRRTLITQFEKSLECNRTVVRFPPPPPLPTPPTMESAASIALKCPTKADIAHEKGFKRHASSSIGADSGVYSGEERYVADPTLAARQQRPHSQCIRWSRLDDDKERRDGDEERCDVELNYCSMNFMVDMDDSSDIYERIDDEISGDAPLAVGDEDPALPKPPNSSV